MFEITDIENTKRVETYLFCTIQCCFRVYFEENTWQISFSTKKNYKAKTMETKYYYYKTISNQQLPCSI